MPVRNPFPIARPLLVSAAVLALPCAVAAQDAAPAPAYLAIVNGAATIDREGAPAQALVNVPVVAGDHLRTTSGRVEILFPDGAALDVDEFSAIELQGEAAVRLTEGRALMRVPPARSSSASYELTTPASAISVLGPGEYRLAYPDAYDSGRVNEFEGWIDDVNRIIADAGDRGSKDPRHIDAPYLPANLQMYGTTLADSGSWQYDAAYGYVWYPQVAVAWRPYTHGSWAPIGRYGWTWIGTERWDWPTHHYGRWGYAHDRWFWIPGRSWAPAWVAWGAAGNYVSWCPLGWDSRPLFNAASVASGWTIVPRTIFSTHAPFSVGHHVVDPRRLPASTAITVQTRAPQIPSRHGSVAGVAATRASAVAPPPQQISHPAMPRGAGSHEAPAAAGASMSHLAPTTTPVVESTTAPVDRWERGAGGVLYRRGSVPAPAAVSMPTSNPAYAVPRVPSMLPTPGTMLPTASSMLPVPSSMPAVPRSMLPVPGMIPPVAPLPSLGSPANAPQPGAPAGSGGSGTGASGHHGGHTGAGGGTKGRPG